MGQQCKEGPLVVIVKFNEKTQKKKKKTHLIIIIIITVCGKTQPIWYIISIIGIIGIIIITKTPI